MQVQEQYINVDVHITGQKAPFRISLHACKPRYFVLKHQRMWKYRKIRGSTKLVFVFGVACVYNNGCIDGGVKTGRKLYHLDIATAILNLSICCPCLNLTSLHRAPLFTSWASRLLINTGLVVLTFWPLGSVCVCVCFNSGVVTSAVSLLTLHLFGIYALFTLRTAHELRSGRKVLPQYI